MPVYEVEVTPQLSSLKTTLEADDVYAAKDAAESQLRVSDLLDGATWSAREVEVT